MDDRPVAIVGGGYSGTMLAARLAEQGRPSILINRTPHFGLGVAYSTPFDGHRLNVRSARMSAVADEAGDFVRWLEAYHPEWAEPDGFAPRRLFGLYIQDRLKRVETTFPGCIERRVADVVSIEADGVTLGDGRRLAARAIVLATGNPAPKTTRRNAAGGLSRIVPDPWAPEALESIGRDDDILILGTGLTMVDMVLALEGRGWRGRATAVSRRGLMPRAHHLTADAVAPPDATMTSGPLSRRVAAARRRASAVGWRTMMEGLRPVTSALWREADVATRSRIVRHLRPWWDVHRHRIAPEVAAVMYRLLSDQRLTLAAGRIGKIESIDEGVVLHWTPRHGPPQPPKVASWAIDCTGPGHDAAGDALTGPLIAAGRVRLDALGLGLDLDDQGRALNAQGHADPALFVLGPPSRAAFWESIAVPDIRQRIETIVQILAD